MAINVLLAQLMHEFIRDDWRARCRLRDALADESAQLMCTIQYTQPFDVSDDMYSFAEWRTAQAECQQNEREIAKLAVTLLRLREIINQSSQK